MVHLPIRFEYYNGGFFEFKTNAKKLNAKSDISIGEVSSTIKTTGKKIMLFNTNFEITITLPLFTPQKQGRNGLEQQYKS
jgi:hypothetical protein